MVDLFSAPLARLNIRNPRAAFRFIADVFKLVATCAAPAFAILGLCMGRVGAIQSAVTIVMRVGDSGLVLGAALGHGWTALASAALTAA